MNELFPTALLPGPLLLVGAAPAFFGEVAALLVASAVVAYLCHRIGVTPIVSFLITGAAIGPYALGLVRDPALIEAAAEVGVVLLLFTIGIEFSLAKLASIQRLIFVGGGLQVGLSVAVVAGLLAAFGVDWRSGVFTGFLVALSSTAIVMKLLSNRGETDTSGGQAVLGILIFQDLAVVAMVLVVPMLAGEGGSPAGIAWALAKAVGIIVLVLVVARRGMPKVLEAVARTCSQEIFILAVMGICFGTAYLTSLAGVSLSLGAFLAGLIVSESRFSDMAFGEIQPLQILFSATFFVSVGLLLDLEYLMRHLPLVLAVVAVVLAVKLLSAALAVRVLGFGLGTVGFASLFIAQVGEFSFVLERTGSGVGLFPGGVADGGPQAFIAATVLLMMATPLLARFGAGVEARAAARSGRREEAAATLPETPEHSARHDDLSDHVVIAGYGKGGRALARALDALGIPHLILTLSPDGAREAEAEERRVLRGNYARRHELGLAGLDRARLLVVADDDLAMTHRVIGAVRAIAPELPILAVTRLAGEIPGLREAGAERVVAEEQEGVVRLVEGVLREYGTGAEELERHEQLLRAAYPGSAAPAEMGAQTGAEAPGTTAPAAGAGTVRLDEAQRENPACAHTGLTREVAPSAAGCEDCLRIGARWVHLRICMTCGHVGCCDSSQHRHASRHAARTGHPIVRSCEPGETWAWCFEDEIML